MRRYAARSRLRLSGAPRSEVRRRAPAPAVLRWPLSHVPARPPGDLRVGAAADPAEAEADRIADRIAGGAGPVGSVPGAAIARKPAAGAGAVPAGAAAESAVGSLGPGQPLASSERAYFEPRFGRDLSQVRIHDGPKADSASRLLSARAFTLGSDIAFAEGEYRPGSAAGRRLLAHELVHTLQQGDGARRTVQRQEGGGIFDEIGKGLEELGGDLKKEAEEAIKAELAAIAAKPGPKALFSKTGCPSNFCQPFADKVGAAIDLALTTPFLLAGIAAKVNPRVVPLWASYLTGGSSPQDLSATFGGDFTASPTTDKTTKFLMTALKREVGKKGNALLGALPAVTVNFSTPLAAELKAIDTQSDPNRMDFNVIADIAGNIAGGIGKDQVANPIGATPSPFDDARQATVAATLIRTKTGMKVIPIINFTVLDTVDLCPGNCGAPSEQVATIPMSRFEATGLAGDVPFVIRFPAPATAAAPFDVAPPPPGAPGKGKKPSAPKSPKGPPKKKGGKKALLDVPKSSQPAGHASGEDLPAPSADPASDEAVAGGIPVIEAPEEYSDSGYA